MRLEDVLNLYGNQYQFHKQTKMSVNTIKNWKRLSYIPILSQIRLEALSNGAITASLEDGKQ